MRPAGFSSGRIGGPGQLRIRHRYDGCGGLDTAVNPEVTVPCCIVEIVRSERPVLRGGERRGGCQTDAGRERNIRSCHRGRRSGRERRPGTPRGAVTGLHVELVVD